MHLINNCTAAITDLDLYTYLAYLNCMAEIKRIKLNSFTDHFSQSIGFSNFIPLAFCRKKEKKGKERFKVMVVKQG